MQPIFAKRISCMNQRFPLFQQAAWRTLPEPQATSSPEEAVGQLVGLPMDEIERRMILATLEHCSGNKSKAARLLGIGLKTLYRKLEAIISELKQSIQSS